MWPFTESSDVKTARLAAELAARNQLVREKNAANFQKGGLGVLVSGSAAILAAFSCKRSVVLRRYRPTRFQSNVLPPPFNPMKDAARAVLDATFLAGSVFFFGVASTFWMHGVGNLRELGQVLSTKYQQTRSDDPELANDVDSPALISQLGGLFRSK